MTNKTMCLCRRVAVLSSRSRATAAFSSFAVSRAAAMSELNDDEVGDDALSKESIILLCEGVPKKGIHVFGKGCTLQNRRVSRVFVYFCYVSIGSYGSSGAPLLGPLILGRPHLVTREYKGTSFDKILQTRRTTTMENSATSPRFRKPFFLYILMD